MSEKAVVRGAKLLDEKVPGWADKINLSKFKMHSSDRCILAQTFGVTTVNKINLKAEKVLNFTTDEELENHGFVGSENNSEDKALAELWKVQVKKRRK